MGQYYKACNLDRKEYVQPTFIKWIEQTANYPALFPYLLADAPLDGGGTPTMSRDDIDQFRDEDGKVDWEEYQKAVSEKWENWGRWAGDSVKFVGDYAESDLYHEVEESDEWEDISGQVLGEIEQAQEYYNL